MPSRRKINPRRNIVTDALAAYDARVVATYRAAAQFVTADPWQDIPLDKASELTQMLVEDMLEKWRRSHGQKASAVPIGGTFLVSGDMEGAVV
jgi:hypothetical protein